NFREVQNFPEVALRAQACNLQRETCNLQPPSGNHRPSRRQAQRPENRQQDRPADTHTPPQGLPHPATCHVLLQLPITTTQPTTGNYKTCNLKLATCILKLATRSLQPATCNLQPATCNLSPLRARRRVSRLYLDSAVYSRTFAA